jgi:hypothetical protein
MTTQIPEHQLTEYEKGFLKAQSLHPNANQVVEWSVDRMLDTDWSATILCDAHEYNNLIYKTRKAPDWLAKQVLYNSDNSRWNELHFRAQVMIVYTIFTTEADRIVIANGKVYFQKEFTSGWRAWVPFKKYWRVASREIKYLY